MLVSTPSYALVIAQAVRDAGIDPASLKLELGLFGGEAWTDGLREEIERALPGLEAVNFYGLSEMCGPGVAAECLEARDGLHVHEDHFLVEVVDPESGEPLDEGAEGELVFTTLVKEAMPMLRYRTGDIASLTFEPCVCGRTTARIRGPARPARRHDHRARRQRLPLERRARAAFGARGRAALPARRRTARARWTSSPCSASPPTRASTPRGSCADVERVLHEHLGIRVRADVLELRSRAAERGQGRARRRPPGLTTRAGA